MRLLLDTHVWLWLAAGDARLSARLQKSIREAQAAGELCVSPISAWEIALLHKRGRIEIDSPIHDWLERALLAPGLNVAALTPRIAMESCLLPEPLHADPADRILIATARAGGDRLVTVDERILAYGAAGHVAVLPV